jgi:hypothetical protein
MPTTIEPGDYVLANFTPDSEQVIIPYHEHCFCSYSPSPSQPEIRNGGRSCCKCHIILDLMTNTKVDPVRAIYSYPLEAQ